MKPDHVLVGGIFVHTRKAREHINKRQPRALIEVNNGAVGKPRISFMECPSLINCPFFSVLLFASVSSLRSLPHDSLKSVSRAAGVNL